MDMFAGQYQTRIFKNYDCSDSTILTNTNCKTVMTNLFYLVPAAAVLALLFAWIFFRQMMKESEGTATMKDIAKFVREGAMAYLKQQYKVNHRLCHPRNLLRNPGLRFRRSELLGSIRIPDRRFLLRTCRLCGNENGHLRILKDGQCRKEVPQFRSEDCVPLRSRYGAYRRRTGSSGHFRLVPDS